MVRRSGHRRRSRTDLNITPTADENSAASIAPLRYYDGERPPVDEGEELKVEYDCEMYSGELCQDSKLKLRYEMRKLVACF